MASINRTILNQYMEAYKRYLDNQRRGNNARPLSNAEEDYKRDIAVKTRDILNSESWTKSEIGEGKISSRIIKAVQRNVNLVGRFQITSFSDKVKENYLLSDQVFYDLYHERNDQECFERICQLFGRKYDLVSYLYFVLDPDKYLPLRSSIFDSIFKKLGYGMQTSGRCSWDNYQRFLELIELVRNEMKEYYTEDDVDLLDAHSFLWTINLGVLDTKENETNLIEAPAKEKKAKIGASVFHKDYGEGVINKVTDEKVYVKFTCGMRIFTYPEAFEKEYLFL